MLSDDRRLQRPVAFQRPPPGKFRSGHLFLDVKGKNSHCFPVGDMALFNLHRDSIANFPGRSVSDWNVALKTWNTTRDLEYSGRREDTAERASIDQTTQHPDKTEKNTRT